MKVQARRVPSLLIIDDDAELLAALQRQLRRSWRVVTTVALQQARKMIDDGTQFDAILCDIRLPESSGPEFFRWLSLRHPSLVPHTGFVTGAAGDPKYQPFVAVHSVLKKPFGPSQLNAFTRQLLAGKGG